MTSNRNIFRITGLLCGEFTGHRRNPLTKASDAELWCFDLCQDKSWANSREAGDFRRHHAHCDVIVMMQFVMRNCRHYCDVVMGATASQNTSLTIVYSAVYSGADQRKHRSSAPLAFVLGIHRGPVNSPHKWPVTRKMFPFDDVIMTLKPR